MNQKRTWTIIALVAAFLAIAYAFIVVGCQQSPDLPPAGATGDSNFTNVVASGDLTAGDDLTVTDDTGIGDDLTVGGDGTLSGALTVSGAATLNGGLAMDTNKFTVANGSGNTTIAGTLTVAGVTTVPTDTEHMGLYTVDTAAITYQSSGALWTVGANEIWIVQAVYCKVTTNFDCTGDNCTLTIGDGNDADGFLVLTDAEMQAADAEFTGAPAGWKGLHTDSIGAYLSGLAPFVYDGTDTIDIAIGGTDPAAGAGTCYAVYLRVE